MQFSGSWEEAAGLRMMGNRHRCWRNCWEDGFGARGRAGPEGTWVQGGAHENVARVRTPEAERLAQHRAPGRLAPTPTPDACVEALTPTVILFRTRGLWEGTGAE